MRPVNLIPLEERPGQRRPMRGGPLAYIVVGAMAAALIAVTVLVITGNQISESKAEIVQLESKKAAVEARAQALDAYSQFHSVREQRVATVTSLADSRFDWERVMRELALVLPNDVWLTNLTGTANPQVSPERSRQRIAAQLDPGAGAGAGRVRAKPGRRRRLCAGAEGDRRRDSRWRAVLGAWRKLERQLGLRHHLDLPDAQLHRPIPDGRRL